MDLETFKVSGGLVVFYTPFTILYFTVLTFVVVVTSEGCFCRKSLTTSGWSDWAARWIYRGTL